MKRRSRQFIQANLSLLALALLLELSLGGWAVRQEIKRWETANTSFQARLIEYKVIGVWSESYVQTVEAAPLSSSEWIEVTTRTIGAGFPVRPQQFGLSQSEAGLLYVDESVYESADGGRSWSVQ